MYCKRKHAYVVGGKPVSCQACTKAYQADRSRSRCLVSILVAAFVIITLGIILVIVVNTDSKSLVSDTVPVSSFDNNEEAPQFLF